MNRPQFQPLAIDRLSPAYAQVAVHLREVIASGQVAVGQRLPSEADLAQSFGVSRTTVREALRVLASEGLLETLRGTSGGSFIRRFDSVRMSELLRTGVGVLVGTDGLQVTDILEARLALEVPAARWAAQRRTAAELAILECALHRPGGDRPAAQVLLEHTEFHMTLVAASHSRLLISLAQPVFLALQDIVRREGLHTVLVDPSQDQHDAIVDALRRGDGELAAAAMQAHLELVARAWDAHLRASATD
jgi:DNA-binding FadR family transcriptional regulator